MGGGVVGGADGEGDAGDAPGDGEAGVCRRCRAGNEGCGPKRGLPLVQRAMVALVMSMVGVLQVVDRVMVLLVMPTAGEGVAADGRLRG